MDHKIETVGRESLSIHRRFYRAVYATPVVICASFLVLVALYTYFSAGENRELVDILYSVNCMVVAGLIWQLPRMIANRAFRNRMKYYNGDIPELTARFGDNLVLEDADSLHTFSYDKITRIHFREDALTVVIAKDRAVCIPVREFTRGSMPELKQFLRQKCPDLKIPD